MLQVRTIKRLEGGGGSPFTSRAGPWFAHRTNKMRRGSKIGPCEEEARRRHQTNIKPAIYFHHILISSDGQDEVQFTFKFLWAWASPPKLHSFELKTRHKYLQPRSGFTFSVLRTLLVSVLLLVVLACRHTNHKTDTEIILQ
jgi:hypothetical protein